MSRLGLCLGLAVMLGLALCTSANAIEGSAVALGFGAEYLTPSGESCVHRGVDVGLAEGGKVSSPVAGEVVFAGRVPGPHGGSILAVSIESRDGRVTLLPLQSIKLKSGDQVVEGEDVGEVASSGDPSTSGVHLHVSLRREGLYLDPTGLLNPTGVPAPEEPPAAPSGASAFDQPRPGGSVAAGHLSGSTQPGAAGSAIALPSGVTLSATARQTSSVGVQDAGAKQAIVSEPHAAPVMMPGVTPVPAKTGTSSHPAESPATGVTAAVPPLPTTLAAVLACVVAGLAARRAYLDRVHPTLDKPRVRPVREHVAAPTDR